MTNAVALQPAKPMDRFRQDLTLREGMIRSLLPSNVTFDKFMAAVVAAVGNNPALLECDRGSLVKACIQAAELGLSLNLTMGECDILKVYDRQKGSVAQFRPRYMGLMKLARQSGEVLKIEAEIVRENDEFLFQKGDEPRLEHRIKLGGRGPMVGAYCIWTLKNGEKQFEVMDRDQIIGIRDRSSAKTKEGKIVGPWATDEEEMWRKTVVRRASKYMPRSLEGLANAVAVDNLHEAGRDVEIDNGQVIDITEDGEWSEAPAPKEATSQVNDLAAKVKSATQKTAWAPEILEVGIDEDGLSDWKTWCEDAIAVVTKLGPEQKMAWMKMHSGVLGEAEMMAPNDTSKLMGVLE